MLLGLLDRLLAHAASRKVALTVTAMLLMSVLGVVSAWLPALGANLVALVGGVTGCLALYIGGNVADGRLQVSGGSKAAASMTETK
jgi:hypothetical protein